MSNKNDLTSVLKAAFNIILTSSRSTPGLVTKNHLPHGVAIGKSTSYDGLWVRSSPTSTTGAIGDSDINSEIADSALFNNRLGLVE